MCKVRFTNYILSLHYFRVVLSREFIVSQYIVPLILRSVWRAIFYYFLLEIKFLLGLINFEYNLFPPQSNLQWSPCALIQASTAGKSLAKLFLTYLVSTLHRNLVTCHKDVTVYCIFCLLYRNKFVSWRTCA